MSELRKGTTALGDEMQKAGMPLLECRKEDFYLKIEAMKFDRTGIILYTLNYQECVRFYGELLSLRKLFETDSLTCFEFGGAYLMVEVDDEYDGTQKESARIKTCLRMNVSNVKEVANELQKKGVEVDYQEHSWGTVAKFFDPDGNLCAFKDSAKFEKQVLG